MAKLRLPPSFLGWLIAGLVKVIGLTLRWRVDDRAGMLTSPPDHPVIWCFWHNRLLMVPLIYWKVLRHRPAGFLTSPSGDGEIVARIMARFGLTAVRGSSNKRPVASLRELIIESQSGRDMGLTPDGPRGPRYVLKAGVILLAQKTGQPVFPVHIRPRRFWQMKTWDRFLIPKPFSIVDVVFDTLQTIPQTNDSTAFEAERARVERLLVEGTGEV